MKPNDKTVRANRGFNASRKMVLLSLAFAVATATAPQVAFGQDANRTNKMVPRIRMQDVPLGDAIKNLARQAGINYIVDPRIPPSTAGRLVTVAWTNMSASEALGRLLKESKLTMITNSVSSVARIVFANQIIRPVSASLGTDEVLPLIVIDDVPLGDAVKNVARQAGLSVTFDPKLRVPSPEPDGSSISECQVFCRWEDVTAKQALAALLENYDLLLVQGLTTYPARIVPKTHAEAGPGAAPKRK